MAKHDKRVKYHSAADKPVMLSLRVPRELNDRLERYASEHLQKVSELVRDAIEMRLDEPADPRSRRPGSSADAPLALVDSADPAHLRRMLREEFEAFLDRRSPLIQAIRQAQPVTDTVTDTQAEPVPDVTDTVTVTEPTVEPFDTTRFRLGKLCPRGHAWGTTGQSLRRNNRAGYCRACNAEDSRNRRQAERQEVSA